MNTYITIDGGTTSTRIRLLKDKKIIETIKLDIGVRNAIDNRNGYIMAIKDAIDEIISRSNETVVRILASGMITSEFGLCNLTHINIPAGVSELHNAMYETVIEEISNIPFVFIKGVKNDSEEVADFDMMRGEETELIGIIEKEYGECIYILPGSHSKVIKVDEQGRITSFSSMLTGEMIASLSQETILKDAVDLSTTEIDKDYLLKGYNLTEKEGVNKALFKVRILNNIFGCSKEEVYSFFLGVILHNEIMSIVKDETRTIVIGGRKQIKNAMAIILKDKTGKEVITLSDIDVDYSTSLGMIKIYEFKDN